MSGQRGDGDDVGAGARRGAGDDRLNVRRSDYGDAGLMAWWKHAYTTDILTRNTFFQSPDWNHCWHDHFVAGDRRRESVLLGVERDGATVAVVPLFMQRRAAGPFTAWRYLLWIGDRLAQYPDMATTEADPGPVWNTVLAWLTREYPDAWLFLRDVLPESTVSAVGHRDARRGDGEEYLRIDLEGLDEQGYVARCAPHMQREIRRARKRLETEGKRIGMTWQAVVAPSAEEVDQLIALNRARFGAASWFADRRNAAFFRDLATRMGQELLLSSVGQEGAPQHVMASYLHGGTVHYVLSGFDERAKTLSPGTMNLDRSICWAIGQGYRYFDFLRGDEGYKREFHPERRRSFHIEWSFPRSGPRRNLAMAMQRLRGVGRMA